MKRIVIILFISLPQWSLEQQRLVENIIPSGDDDLNYEDLYENIAQLTANPINLNTTSVDALLSIGILTPAQANDIINYRISNGDLLEIYELQSIASLDLATINELRPFVTVRSSMPGKKLLDRVRSRQSTYFFTRYERTVETSEASPARIYSRFRTTSPGDLSIGITAEKDAGEHFEWTRQQRGFDFYSGHVQLINKGPVANIIAGDYTAQFGQGLTMGGGFGIGKGSETITTLRRSSTGFLPYTSANEAGFFRGAAASISLPASIIAHVFASSLPRDASQADEGSLAVLQSGKHRTPTEIENRHRMREKNFGGVVEYKGHSLQSGIIFHRTDFSQPLNKSPAIYNSFDFRGISNSNVGIFASYNLQNISFFSEASQTIGGGRGWLCGALATVSRNVDVSLLVRRYDRNFISFYSSAISENTAPKNESGVYWGWKHAISRKLSYTAYVDLFMFPWLKFRTYQPTAGNETLVRFTWRQSKSAEFFLQFRDERKARNVTSEGAAYQLSTAVRRNWILGSSLSYGDLSLKSRIQWSSYRQLATSRGFAMAADLGYDWKRVSIATRFAVFDTDDFDNRQYMNERDVLMAFSFPAYYGQGTRTYVVARYQPVKWLDLWVKLSETDYFMGEKRRDVKVEVVFKAG